MGPLTTSRRAILVKARAQQPAQTTKAVSEVGDRRQQRHPPRHPEHTGCKQPGRATLGNQRGEEESQAQNQTTGSYSQRNPSSASGIWSALIQFAAVCFETMCKRCGRSARIFCTYLQRAGGNSELMRTESRWRNLPEAGPNPPSRVQYSAQPPSIIS